MIIKEEKEMNEGKTINGLKTKNDYYKGRYVITWIVRGLLLLLIAVCLTLGIAGGGLRDVKNKAIRICYECIGIG